MFNLSACNPKGYENRPVALSAQVLYGMSKSDYLNPANKGQQSPTCCLKPVRAVARFVCATVGPLFASVIGVFYHGVSAAINQLAACFHRTDCQTYKIHRDLADQHFNAALTDGMSLCFDVGSLGYGALIRGGLCALNGRDCAGISATYFHFTDVEMSVLNELNQRA